MTTQGTLRTTRSGRVEEVFALPANEVTLHALITDVFERWWDAIHFGVLVEGAAWEVAAPNAPERISLLDGYLTVDFGAWHFHLCIGEHRTSDPELAAIRRCSTAELYRGLRDGKPVTWGLRLLNGEGTQQMTVMLPNPWLSHAQKIEQTPTWERLEAWDHLRQQYLGLGPDPVDRTGTGFHHAG